MLTKLIKYDLKSNLKFISIFYILGLFFALLTRIFFSIENSLFINILGQITTGGTISMLISILINNLMRFWVRFKNTVYEDESYLTHTLPIDKKTLYLSKITTSVITMFISFLVAGIILFIAYYSKENIELLKNMLLPISTMLNSELIEILLILIILVFLQFYSIQLCGYLGIIIGHIFNNYKSLKSVIFGFIVYIIFQMFTIVSLLIAAIFNRNLLEIFTQSNVTDLSILKTLSIISIVSYIIIIIINIVISIKIFNKGVNVD